MIRTIALACALMTAPACASPPASTGSAPSGDARALLHRLQDAVGGADKIAAIADFDQTVTGVSFDGRTGQRLGEVRKRVRWIKPNLLRLDQVGPGDTYVLYFDGTSGWEILPDGSVHDLSGGELRFAQGYLRGFILKTLLADRDPAYEVESPARNVLRIRHREATGGASDLVLDPDSGLPLAETSVSLADPANPVSSETRYLEWKTVGGVRFASRFTKTHAGLHVADALIDGTTLNSGLRPEDLAAKPPDLAPVMR